MRGALDIEADLTLTASIGSIRIHAQGRGVWVEATSLRVFRDLPGRSASLSQLRRLADALALCDQALVVQAAGRPVVEIDPALNRRWLGRLLRVPGLKFHFRNWLRARA